MKESFKSNGFHSGICEQLNILVMALRKKEQRLTSHAECCSPITEHQYTCIEAIINNTSPNNCNVYGVVIDLKEPFRSKGSGRLLFSSMCHSSCDLSWRISISAIYQTVQITITDIKDNSRPT